MGRPTGSKNRKTLLREAHLEHVDDLKEHEIIDSIHVLQTSMRHFFYRALRGKAVGRTDAQIDEDFLQASTFASALAPYKHARLGAIKVTGDVNKQIGLGDDASVEELRAEVMKHLTVLAPVLNLPAVDSVIEAGRDWIAHRDVAPSGKDNGTGTAG